MPETPKTRDWHDWIIAASSILQTLAIVCGVFFAISELRDRGEIARQARIEQARKQMEKIQQALDSVRPGIDALKSHIQEDKPKLKWRRWVGNLKSDSNLIKGYPIEVEIKEAPDESALIEVSSNTVTDFLRSTEVYRDSVTRYIECVDMQSCDKEAFTVRICLGMREYINQIGSYFDQTNSQTETSYFLPADFDIRELTSLYDDKNVTELLKSKKIEYGCTSYGTFTRRLSSENPFFKLGEFVSQYNRSCAENWQLDWLFSSSSGAGC
jgi:hypothetical protein